MTLKLKYLFYLKRTSKIIPYSLVGMAITLLISWKYLYVPDISVEVLNQKYNVKPSHYIEVHGMIVHYRIDGPETGKRFYSFATN